MLTIFLALINTAQADTSVIRKLAVENGFAPSKRVMKAISNAARVYKLDVKKLAAIAIVETGIGKYTQTRKNKNGTYDMGLFQINTVNQKACSEFRLETDEGSAMCAAKLLSALKRKWPKDYHGRYHSHTASLRDAYKIKVELVMRRGYTEYKQASAY